MAASCKFPHNRPIVQAQCYANEGCNACASLPGRLASFIVIVMGFWPTVRAPLVSNVVCLSVCLSSVTICIVAKRHILAKNCLKEQIG